MRWLNELDVVDDDVDAVEDASTPAQRAANSLSKQLFPEIGNDIIINHVTALGPERTTP